MVTVCESLANNIQQGAFTHTLQRETIELLDLIPQILSTDTHPARLQSLLYVAPRPFAVLSSFLRLRLAITPELRLFALKTLSQVINVCTSPDAITHLAPRLKELLAEAMAVEQAVALACSSEVNTTEAVAAVEMLFVLAMKLPSIRTALKANGLTRCLFVMFQTDSTDLRCYLAGIARLYADQHADVFTGADLQFCRNCLNLLCHETSKQCLVLILETLTIAIRQFHSLYWSYCQVEPNAELLIHVMENFSFRRVDHELQSGSDALLKAAIHVEGVSSAVSEGQQPLLQLFASKAHWERTFAPSEDGLLALPRLTLLRVAVFASHHTDLIRSMEHAFATVVPSLCAGISPENNQREIIIECALIFAAMCAKCPSVRALVRGMVDGYAPWARHLFGTVRHALEHYVIPAAMLKGVLLFDVHQTLLNDGAQAQTVDYFSPERLATALLAEQNRREGTEVPALDQQVLDYYYDRGCPSNVLQLCQQLIHAILISATSIALIEGEQGAQQAVLSGHLTPERRTTRGASPPVHATTPRQGKASLDDSGYLPAAHSPAPRSARGVSPAKAVSNLRTKQTVPFRPSSPGTKYGFTPQRFTGLTPQGSGSTPHRLRRVQTTADGISIVVGPKHKASDPDEYLMMAITMHLPITYGIHYNRTQKASVRRIEGPAGAFVQPIHRNTSQTWTAEDVQNGELYVLFLPYSKISAERINQEIRVVESHVAFSKKTLLVTPQNQKGRRWFLHDMLNYILPKTELLLRDFLELVENYGADDVVYQLGVIRLVDEAAKERQGAFAVAAAQADIAMPEEILRISSGRFKDVLHSGNITYAISRLRDHYKGIQSGAGAGGAGDYGLGLSSGLPSQLVDIDREIHKLERRAAEDVWGTEAQDPRDDDVESDYSESNMNVADVPSASHYLVSGKPAGSEAGSKANTAYASTTTGYRSGPTDEDDLKELPAHMRAKVNDLNAAPFGAPSLADFDSLYAAVENKK